MASDMAERVYALAKAIPAGSVASYGQLAALSGHPRAARIVGQLMRRCAPSRGVPCHRVVLGDGRSCPAGASCVLRLQRALLAAEGVPFLADGRVDMAACRWQGPFEKEQKL